MGKTKVNIACKYCGDFVISGFSGASVTLDAYIQALMLL